MSDETPFDVRAYYRKREIGKLREACAHESDDDLFRALLKVDLSRLSDMLKVNEFQMFLSPEEFTRNVTQVFGKHVRVYALETSDSYLAKIYANDVDQSEEFDDTLCVGDINFTSKSRQYNITLRGGEVSAQGRGETGEAAYQECLGNWRRTVAFSKERIDLVEAMIAELSAEESP